MHWIFYVLAVEISIVGIKLCITKMIDYGFKEYDGMIFLILF